MMLYKATLTSREHGNICIRFGDYDYLLRHVKHNADRFDGVVSPAHYDDIKTRVDELEYERDSVQRKYDVSPWGEGPRYRERLDSIDRELRMMREHLERKPA